MRKIKENVFRYAITKLLKGVVETASSYSLDDVNIQNFINFSEIFYRGYRFSKEGWRILYRGTDNRFSNNNSITRDLAKGIHSVTPGDFYRNTILGISNNKPVYDSDFNWIDQPSKLQVNTFKPSIQDFYKFLPSLNTLSLFCNDLKDGELHIEILSDALKNIPSPHINNFGDDSYCKLGSLIDLVTDCYQNNHHTVLVLEIGQGSGYWVNKAASILKSRNIPCKFICIEKYFFNSINTQYMSKFFGTSSDIISIASDAHFFDWEEFFSNTPLFHQLPIVIHTSGVFDPFINHKTIYRILASCSNYNLFGGLHYEHDAFTLMRNEHKTKFINLVSGLKKLGFPKPPISPSSLLSNIVPSLNAYSYLDPSYFSNINTALNFLGTKKKIIIQNTIPLQQISTSPLHLTSWRTC